MGGEVIDVMNACDENHLFTTSVFPLILTYRRSLQKGMPNCSFLVTGKTRSSSFNDSNAVYRQLFCTFDQIKLLEVTKMSEQRQQGQEKGSTKRSPRQDKAREEILREFGASTSDMIQKAAFILEEEVAAGLLAAKEVEQSIRQSGEVQSESLDDIVVRLRKDAHDVVNIIGEQADQMRSEEFDDLSVCFQKDAHEAVDVLLNIVTNAPNIINRLLQAANIETRRPSTDTRSSADTGASTHTD